MDNDVLFISLCVIVILIFVGVFIFWSKASSTAPVVPSLETTAGQKQSNVSNKKQVQNLAGVYAPARLNERCAVGPVNNISLSVLLPGYFLPQKCDTGYECIKLADSEPYGYCKAMMGTNCNTVYDCAPPATGITGIYCNNVCSDREYGSLLEQCGGNTGYFSCDTTQNLICNIVPTRPTGICFDRFEFPCQNNQDCPQGTCVKNPNTTDPDDKYCVCPGLNNPVNTKVCMYLDGMPCMHNQECYGGICFKSDIGLTGVCKTLFFPGKECEIDIGNTQGCLNGYGCGFSGSEEFSPFGICQPNILVGTGPNAVQLPAVTDQIFSLCTSYNVLTGPSGTVPTEYLPGLFCDPTKDLVCNYDLGTRGPVGYIPYSYLQGFGTCEVPSAKIGQICNRTTACVPPAVCIQGNDGVSTCSRPQYIDGDPLTFYVNNVNTLNDLNSNSNSIFTTIQNQYPNITDYNTLNIHLVGGGAGGGAGYYNSNPSLPGTGFYGGAGGGSGQILGYIDAKPSPTGVTGTAYYTNTNDSGVYPNPFTIDLNSFEWDDIQLNIGSGGAGGNSTTFTPGAFGADTVLNFSKNWVSVLNLPAPGGTPGQNGNTGTNGNGGAGYNGGGAAAGGTINTPESVGGNGLLSIGGQNGFNATVGTQFNSGNGGGVGGGLGGTKFLQVYGSSEGGAGGAGTCVTVKDNNGNFYRTGGDASSSLSSPFNSIPAKSGFDFSGAGAGGGSITLDGGGNLSAQNGGQGGSGYAILRFSKVVKNINYAGKQNKEYKVPASGSSGVCAEGYVANGLNQVSSTAPNFCIPKQYYTCNTQNPDSAMGTFCMNPANTNASGTCGSDYKIGVYIPIPPALQTTLGSNVQNEYFGKWHFLNLPVDGLGNTVNPNVNSQLSVYQVFDNTSSMFYPKTRIIYHPYNGLTNFYPPQQTRLFYYATLDTKDISPNNPSNTLNVTVTWTAVYINATDASTILWDIKFTSAGNITFYLAEGNDFIVPFNQGDTANSGPGSVFLTYSRIYIYPLNSSSESTMLSTGLLTYTKSPYGPMFCINPNNPSVTTNDAYPVNDFNGIYNNSNGTYFLGNVGLMWDVDDLINNSIAIGFLDKNDNTKFDIFSASIPTTAGGLNDLYILNYGIQVSVGSGQNYPMFLKYYSNIQPGTTAGLGANPQKFLWTSFNLNNNFYQNYIYVNIPDVPLIQNNLNFQKFLLEESDQAYSFGMNFNRITDLGFFDFYYVTTGDQFKYTTVSSDMTNLQSIKFNPQELQVDGYTADLYHNLPSQLIWNIPFLCIGNIDRSMYSFVQTCQ